MVDFCYSQPVMAQPQGDLQLRIGYWIVSHKQTLRTWWALTLLAIMFLSVIWTLVFFFIYFSQESKLNEQLLGAVQGAGSFRSTVAQPQELTIGTAEVIVRDTTSVDVVTELTNPNAAWGASTITAHLTVNGTAQPAQQLFLNPSAHRPVLGLNVKVDNSANVTAVLVVDAVTWARASSAALPEPNFTIDNPVAEPSTVTVNGVTRDSVSVHAAVTNASVYSFNRVSIPILVLSGTRVVGATEVTLNHWDTFVEKPIIATYGYPITGVTTIRIEPQVSRFDTSNTYR